MAPGGSTPPRRRQARVLRPVVVAVGITSTAIVALVSLGVSAGTAQTERAGGATTVPTVTTVTPTTETPTTVTPTTRATVPRTVPVVPTSPATTSPATTTTSTTVAPAAGSSNVSATTIALITGSILAVALIGLVILLIVRGRKRDKWRGEARIAVAEAQRLTSSVLQGLATLSEPAAAAHTWSDVEAQGADLHRRLQALSQDAPDGRGGAAAARNDQALQALRAAIESDRSLRLGPPPPTREQLGYSEAVVRERTSEFEHAVEDVELLVRSER